MVSWFKYVRFADVPAHEEKGWVVDCKMLSPHGEWSVLMRWTGEGEP